MQKATIPQALLKGADKLIETSCAYIVLKANEAFKVKKPVDYGFLDYSTYEKRLWALERELEFNRLTSDDIYRAVEHLEGEPILRMRRFDDQAVLANRFDANEAVSLQLMEDIGKTIADFHARTKICCDPAHADNTAYVINSNRENIALFTESLGRDLVAEYDVAIHKAYKHLEKDVQERSAGGYIRRCHGDLHLGNILIEEGRPVLFDCIEFNDRLIYIDVLYDLAFILMDLWVRGQNAAANQVMNAWFEVMARKEADSASLYGALKLLPLYLSVRAAVRCHVNAHAAKSDETLMDKARIYLRAAIEFLKFETPRLIAIGGLSGSGKSYQAKQIAPKIGRPAGAVIVRSDDIRKRLWGVESHSPLPPLAYDGEHGLKTLAQITLVAQVCLRAGHSVVVDATFREQFWRDKMLELSLDLEVEFQGYWLDVDDAVRMRRVSDRHHDISDADVKIASNQVAPEVLSSHWVKVTEVML